MSDVSTSVTIDSNGDTLANGYVTKIMSWCIDNGVVARFQGCSLGRNTSDFSTTWSIIDEQQRMMFILKWGGK